MSEDGGLIQVAPQKTERAGLTLDDFRADKARSAWGIFDAREAVQVYLMEGLEKNQDALLYLKQRGVDADMRKEWGIGYSDGGVYSHFKGVFRNQDGTPNLILMQQVGIARRSKNTYQEYIGGGVLTIPHYHDRPLA